MTNGLEDEALLAALRQAIRSGQAVPPEWIAAAKSAFAWRSIPITCKPLSNARGGSRSATPRAIWYAARNPNQIASCRPKSAHPRGNTRRPAETMTLTRNAEF